MANGCIPVRIGKRAKGVCEPPLCRPGYGFPGATNVSHLPFAHAIDWDLLPELDEASFLEDPVGVLEDFRRRNGHHRKAMRAEVERVQSAFVYGWGSALTTTHFGDAASYVWESIVQEVIYGRRE